MKIQRCLANYQGVINLISEAMMTEIFDHQWATGRRLARMLNMGHQAYYAMTDDGARFLGLAFGWPEHDGSFHVAHFGVKHSFRRMGIGRALMEYVYEVNGMRPLTLHVQKKNEGAYKFYRALGCKKVTATSLYAPTCYRMKLEGVEFRRLA
ncbi:MAG: GNAT family N-acetyltransferase [Candidatus Adiutrix sp.]|jgi:ribosomal protein S18 acetylase RimI-like enzyme|nr:GNAT family N-acetyltransferase [Candidatus Adiutrix sp.]